MSPFDLLPRIAYRDRDAPTQFAHSLHQTGFAILRDPPLSLQLVQAVYSEWAAFFNSDHKYSYKFDPQRQAGFFPFQTEHAKDCDRPDLKEFYHLYRGEPLPTGISDCTWQLFDTLVNLAEELLGWLESHCPAQISQNFSVPLQAMINNSPENLLRLIHYPGLNSEPEPGSLRAAAHEDVNLITLLPAATTTGLEIRDNQGHWYTVPSDRGDLVINVGDMLQLTSRGYYRSTTHRVVNPAGESLSQPRYSMPLFLHPRPEVVLAEGVTARAFLNQRLREIGLLSAEQSR